MRRNTLRLLACASAVALGTTISTQTFAQVETVQADLITQSAISSNNVSNLDFGEWVLQIGTADDAANDVTLTLTNDGTVNVTAANNTDSALIEVTPGATEGVLTVQTPAPAVLTLTRSATSDFADAGLGLTAVSYLTATEGPLPLNADAANGNVTVVGTAVDETVTLGGTITVVGTPADATHSATFTATFSY